MVGRYAEGLNDWREQALVVRSRGIATDTSRQGQELTRKHTCVKSEEEEEEEEKAFLDIAQVRKGSVRQGGCGAAARFASIVHAVKNPICRLEGN